MPRWLYWVQQADKTRQLELKYCYRQATSDAFDALFAHPLTTLMDDSQQPN
jgi:hypothetical protein